MTEATGLLERLAATQADAIEQASQWCADAIAADGLVHLFGTGHSRIPVEEMFPRYGSYPGFNPIVELSMTFHTQVVGANGQRQAMFIERMPGLAEVILSNFTFGPKDVLIVFSAGGTTAVPVEMARGARRRGLRGHRRDLRRPDDGRPTSIRPSGAGSSTRPTSSSTSCTPHADAMVTLDGLDTPVGPGSTIAAVAIVNSHQGPDRRAARRAAGAMPPVITRASRGRRANAHGPCSIRPTESMRGGSLAPSTSRRGGGVTTDDSLSRAAKGQATDPRATQGRPSREGGAR